MLYVDNYMSNVKDVIPLKDTNITRMTAFNVAMA